MGRECDEDPRQSPVQVRRRFPLRYESACAQRRWHELEITRSTIELHRVVQVVALEDLDWATFLLGEVTQVSRYVSTALDAAERQHRMFYYGQDTCRMTPKLTVKLRVALGSLLSLNTSMGRITVGSQICLKAWTVWQAKAELD